MQLHASRNETLLWFVAARFDWDWLQAVPFPWGDRVSFSVSAPKGILKLKHDGKIFAIFLWDKSGNIVLK